MESICSFIQFFCERAGYTSIEITVNNVVRGAIFVDNEAAPSAYSGTTCIAVFVLNQGEYCFIRTHSTYHSNGNINSNSEMRTSFSGVNIC